MSALLVRNIIFDLGGVVLNINTRLTIEALKNLGWNNASDDEELKKHKEIFFNLEKGLTSPLTFRDQIRQLAGFKNSDRDIDDAWTAMILDIPADRVSYLENLKKHYRLFLLSNTNEIHKEKYHREFEQNYGYPFFALFERIHYSHEMKKRKPDPDIFLQVLEENSLVPADSLFIDDMEENVKSAEAVGMKGLYIQPGTLLDVLPAYLKNP